MISYKFVSLTNHDDTVDIPNRDADVEARDTWRPLLGYTGYYLSSTVDPCRLTQKWFDIVVLIWSNAKNVTGKRRDG